MVSAGIATANAATRQRSSRCGAALAASARPLSRSFYARPVLTVARAVLGRVLVHDALEGRVSGRIVEVEAYHGAEDPASHAYRGRTARNAVMFGRAGHAYVHFTYGMHFCLNLVTGREGIASAVLIRALEPLAGEELMRRRRGQVAGDRLARGPGCVGRALGLDRSHNGLDLVQGPLWIAAGRPWRGTQIIATPRIGIRQARHHAWRFLLEDHPCVSGPTRLRSSGPRAPAHREGSSRLTLP